MAMDYTIPPFTTADGNVVRLIICRHGETALNADKVLQGSGVDPPLNAKGLKQAQCLSQRLKNVEVDWIVSSELERAVQTAQEVLKYHPNVPFTKYAALAEINWGIYEGKVSPDLSTIFDAWKAGNFAAKPPKGESPLECESRVIPCLLSIVHKANTLNNKKQKTVVVICHGRLLRIILASLLHQSLYFMSAFTHQNTGVNVLDFVIDPTSTSSSSIFAAARPFSSLSQIEVENLLITLMAQQTKYQKLTAPLPMSGLDSTILSTSDSSLSVSTASSSIASASSNFSHLALATPPPLSSSPRSAGLWMIQSESIHRQSRAWVHFSKSSSSSTSSNGGSISGRFGFWQLISPWRTRGDEVQWYDGRLSNPSIHEDGTVNVSTYNVHSVLLNDVEHLQLLDELEDE